MNFTLSEQQLEVVNHEDGALLVVAGPGSGKTRVLTERVRRLLLQNNHRGRVLALTFTNKAANEMIDRLSDLGELKSRVFIGTLHSFCLDLLSERGKPLGINGTPHIFEQYADRKQILTDAALEDPYLSSILAEQKDAREKSNLIDNWLREISSLKAHPVTRSPYDDERFLPIYEAYNAGLRACGAYDFDDLLLLTYELLNEQPKISGLYRRIYNHICIDEAQDLNEAQYAVIKALCGAEYKNVMMVGDPKQSIYGFNTSDPKFMRIFSEDFEAKEIELTHNFRSSQSVVRSAQSLVPNYMAEARLPIKGEVKILAYETENDEAETITRAILHLHSNGHPDVEGDFSFDRIAVLGRTRFSLLKIEKHLKEADIPYYKRASATREFSSPITEQFMLALRIYANPLDKLHINALEKRWGETIGHINPTSKTVSCKITEAAYESGDPGRASVAEAISQLESTPDPSRKNLLKAISILKLYADQAGEEIKREVYEDMEVISSEWDGYLRNTTGERSIAGFLSSMALGSTQKTNEHGVALLTVHASKGLEFDAVFVAGMAEGVFPDYRAKSQAALEEEERSAFVAITRSKRLLYLTFPKRRIMPWGDEWIQRPSRFLVKIKNG